MTPHEKLAQKLRAIGSVCPICAAAKWLVGTTPLAVMERKGVFSRKGIPVIAATCRECGYVALFKEDKLG